MAPKILKSALTPTECKHLNRLPKNWQSWLRPRDDP